MVFEQKCGFSVVVFYSHAAISLWFLLFFRFFGSDFFLNGFLNPFTAHSRPRILFELNFHFSLVVFFVHRWHFDIDFFFVFFLLFDLIFLKMVFSIHSLSILGLVFLFSQWKFFELYVRTCPAMFFVSSSDALLSFYICSHSKAEKVKFSEWLLPLTNGICAGDVISHSL